MKKTLSTLLSCVMLLALLAPCAIGLAEESEIVDGRFVTTRQITVEVYDRNNDGGSTPEDNFYTNFIKEGMLRDHNVEVTFVPVGRWTEDTDINNLLAAGSAPDVCVTYNYPAILAYANMGGVIDLAPLLEENKDLLPNLWDLLGETNLYWNRDPVKGTIWAIEARLNNNQRINTFVREDWLNALGLAEPTTLEEFEAMLHAFKDNAELLLGDNAAMMIPFSTSFDVGWRADHLTAAFIPTDLTDKDFYVNGFDDRHLLYPGYKEGIRKLNQWYNEGLMWNDFALYGEGDQTEDNLMKSGFVGAFIHNWDYPYRNGEEGIHYNLQTGIGEEAAFIAVEAFQNDEGEYRKFLSNPIDRKLFLPATNDEPLASMLYLDWISTFENRFFLQFGEEGVTHEKLEDGTIKTIAVTGEKIMNSPANIDYTITMNGLNAGTPETTSKSIALGYGHVDSRFIEKAFAASVHDGYTVEHYNVGEVKSEEGMATPLKEKRNALFAQAVVAPVDQFDAVYDAGMADYLATGGQAIIDERLSLYEQFYE